MYRMPCGRRPEPRHEGGSALSAAAAPTQCFATIAVDQVRGRATREPDNRPVLERVASLKGRTNHAVATSSSNRHRGAVRGADARGTSSATTRPWGHRDPLAALGRRMYRLRLSFSCRIPVSMMIQNIATGGRIRRSRNGAPTTGIDEATADAETLPGWACAPQEQPPWSQAGRTMSFYAPVDAAGRQTIYTFRTARTSGAGVRSPVQLIRRGAFRKVRE
jgi:hypothetical protein